jgi:hypothetical protein
MKNFASRMSLLVPVVVGSVGICFLLSASFVSAQSIKLPRVSNVYPDTFAVYWQHKPEADQYSRQGISIQIRMETWVGDELLKTKSADTLVAIPFYLEYMDDEVFIISGIFFRNDRPVPGSFRQGDPVSLKVLPKSDKIEALIELQYTNASPFNLVLLAEAYEEAQCLVNAMFVYKRIYSIDALEGKKHWDQFYKRNATKLNAVSASGAVHR